MNTENLNIEDAYKELLEKEDARNKTIDSIISLEVNDVTKENANVSAETINGQLFRIWSETSKQYAIDHLLSPEVLKYKNDNILYIHDLDFYTLKTLTCVQTPLDKIFENGFVLGPNYLRAPKRIETAVTLSSRCAHTTQSVQHGGQSQPAFDFYMAPYVRMTYIEELKKIENLEGESYEELYYEAFKDYTIKELKSLVGTERIKQVAMNATVNRVHQAMESLVAEYSTSNIRSGGQPTFISLNWGTDTSAEGRCIIRELLNTTYEGVGNGQTAIFPIHIMKIKDGVNYKPGDPNYDLYELACKVTAKRFFPNFLNLDATFNHDDAWDANDPKRYEHEVATMGCRTRVYENRFGPKTSIGRGNLSFSTINIVRLAIRCMEIKNKEERIAEFFKKLDDAINITAQQLDERYQYQKTALAKQFPLLMSGVWIGSENLKPDDTVESVMNQGTLGIGFIGLAECLIALVGKHHGESEEAQELGLKIIGHMRDRANDLSEKYQHNYSILATPAEGLSGKFTKIDKKDFGIIPGVTDKDYYTNSNHVPVYYKISALKKAKIEAPYHDLTRAGHIFYVEIDGDATHNPEVVMDVVKLMHDFNMGYCSINHNRNRCLDCGYEDATKGLKVCPKCGSHNIDVLARVTGYLTSSVSKWNSGKKAELKDRVKHISNENND